MQFTTVLCSKIQQDPALLTYILEVSPLWAQKCGAQAPGPPRGPSEETEVHRAALPSPMRGPNSLHTLHSPGTAWGVGFTMTWPHSASSAGQKDCH